MSDSVRTRKVESLIQELVAGMIIRGDVKDPRVSTLLSVTRVEMTSDLVHAKVYISTLEGPGKLDKGVKALNHASGFIQYGLGKKLRMRNTPKLLFLVDESIREGFELNKKIDHLFDS